MDTQFREQLLSTVIERSLDDAAIDRLSYEVVGALLKRSDSPNPAPPGRSPLAQAIANRDAMIERLLVDYGGDPDGRIATERPPAEKRGWRFLDRWRRRDGSMFNGPKLPMDDTSHGVPFQLRPLDFAMWYDYECAVALIEHGATADPFPRVLIHALTR